MKPSTAYYTVVRYMPDLARQEFVNVGAIVVYPEKDLMMYDFKVVSKRINCFDRGFDKSHVEGLKSWLESAQEEASKGMSYRIFDAANLCDREIPFASKEYLEELSRIQSHSALQCSHVDVVEFANEDIGAEHLSQFMGDLITRLVDISPAEKKPSEPKFKTTVKEALSERGLLGKKLTSGRVVPNAVIEGTPWKFDFAQQNGVLKAIETLDLMADQPIHGATGFKYMKLSEARAHYEEHDADGFEGVVVYYADDRHEDLHADELEALQSTSKLVNFWDEDARTKFLTEIEDAANSHPLF